MGFQLNRELNLFANPTTKYMIYDIDARSFIKLGDTVFQFGI